MKRMTIVIIAALVLMGLGFVPAQAEASGEESAAMLANDAGLRLEGLRRDAGLFYDPPRASVVAEGGEVQDDEGLLTCHLTGGCGYIVNSQVLIDLRYRLVEVEESEQSLARNVPDGDRFSPNVVLGLHVNF